LGKSEATDQGQSLEQNQVLNGEKHQYKASQQEEETNDANLLASFLKFCDAFFVAIDYHD
jgi:hypothetical protein